MILKPVNIANKKFKFNDGVNDLMYLKDYFPKNKFSYTELTENQIDDREYIYKFKNGDKKTAINLAKNIDYSLKMINYNLENSILVIIPASTSNKTLTRLYLFSSYLSKLLKIKNGYEAIKTLDHSPFKGSYGIDKTQYLTFNHKMYQGKNVILFDDLITTGETFGQVSEKILQSGASSVSGIFIAQTIR